MDQSPWPISVSFAGTSMLIWFVNYMNNNVNAFFLFSISLVSTVYFVLLWASDMVKESLTYDHTAEINVNMKIGMLFFILSEVMFFFGFFWAFFNSSLTPAVYIGNCWPPLGVEPMSIGGIPLLNTIILLTSGMTVTKAHHVIAEYIPKTEKLKIDFPFYLIGYPVAANLVNQFNKMYEERYSAYMRSVFWLGLTVSLGILFLGLQVYEYKAATFNISTNIYGTTFFVATGFHGFHVFVGMCLLSICYFRNYFRHFTENKHVGFEAAAWYWHFVDVVWLFLVIFIYYWGTSHL